MLARPVTCDLTRVVTRSECPEDASRSVTFMLVFGGLGISKQLELVPLHTQ